MLYSLFLFTMSGHSHWAGIKHHKGVNDAKRAAIFTKYGRAIIVAASHGGGNPDTNFALRLAIDQAHSVNMPKENIERAIARGSGELKEGAQIEELTYEAYGPGNVAMLIETTTDNKNRTVSEIKTLLTKGGGKFVPAGSLSFLFKRVGRVSFPCPPDQKESLELFAIEAGAEDFSLEDDTFSVFTKPTELQTVKAALEAHSLVPTSALLGYLPVQTVTLTGDTLNTFERLYEVLDDHPDVQTIWHNLK